MTYCDGCHHDDPFECGAKLAKIKRRRADELRRGLVTERERFVSTDAHLAEQLDLAAAELEQCGCPHSCHDGAVDQQEGGAG